MRICYLADGNCKHAQRWMHTFGARGHEMHFVSFRPVAPEHVEAIRAAGCAYHGEVGPFHVKRFWRTARDLRWLVRLLRRERVELLHCHFLSVNAWYAALTGFRPLAITVMGGGDVRGPGWRPEGVRERLLTPFALRAADLVTSWSRVMAEAVRPYCRPETPVEVIHGGVDLERFSPGPDPARLRERWSLPAAAEVVFSARLMRPLSNIDLIAEAAPLVCRERPNAYFLFAAPKEVRDESYERRVRETLRRGGVEARARFVGAIPHAEMADYHRLAAVTVSVPSTDGTPTTVMESMACGTPVVVNDIPDYDPQYIEPGETALAARAGDAVSLARAILSVLGEPQLARHLREEARRRIMLTGSHDAQMSRLERLYESIAGRAG
jgi:glycosyltransferase involved in cell wall biosynthesis